MRIIAAAALLVATSAPVAVVGFADSSASAVSSRSVAAVTAAANPWLGQRVMNMAHSGGEHEAPMNTLYAFKRAAALGADMLELDVQVTADDQVVVLHNATVDETTNGTGYVKDLTLAQVQALDAGYWFVPGESARHGRPAADYTLRGARTGTITVPGYAPDDFAIPTLAEVLEAFPSTPINIEIKGTADNDTASYLKCGRLLAELLNSTGRTDFIVGSFNDEALADFHARAPQIPMSAARSATVSYVAMGVPLPEGTVALQVPITFLGNPLITRQFVDKAHRDGYAVHAWFSGSAPDDAATYNSVIDTCVDGLMPAKPSVLEAILEERGIERPTPGGTARRAGCEPPAPPTPTPTPSPTPTVSPSPSPTPTAGPSPSPSPSPSMSPSPSVSPSPTPPVTPTPSVSPTTPRIPGIVQTDGWVTD